jgi:hypothetical protein
MGGGGPTQSTVTQSNLPDYAEPYFTNLMQRAQKESTQKYIPYKRDRIADMKPETKEALGMATDFARSDTGVGGVTDGLNAIQREAMSLKYDPSSYQAMMLGYGTNGLNETSAQQIGFGQNGLNEVGTSNFDTAARDRYMSPYMDAVVNRAQANATDQFNQQQATRNLQAAKAGSFGGSRAAVQNAIAQNALNNNLTDIYVNGQQSAYENAQNQFNTDTDRQLQAAVQNQNTALGFNQGNQQADLESQMGNQSTALAFNQSNQQSDFNAAQMNEQSRQFGADYRIKALDLARSAGMDNLTAIGQGDDMMQQRIQAMLGVGQTKEDYRQRNLDQKYADFVNQRDSERQNLQFLSSILQGVPISPNREIVTGTSQNNIAGAVGSLGGLATLNGLGAS